MLPLTAAQMRDMTQQQIDAKVRETHKFYLDAIVSYFGLPNTLTMLAEVVENRADRINDADYINQCLSDGQALRDFRATIRP